MNEKDVQKLLIEILFAVVNQQESSPEIAKKVTPDIILPVCRLAKKHDLAHVVSKFIYQNQIEIDSELKARLTKEELTSVYRYERMKFTLDEICSAFDNAKIAYVPLKGSVLRPYYPYESMRTSCDIDILIHESDLKKAIDSLEEKGYRCGERTYHDVSLFSPSEIHLELHFSIQENMDALDSVLKDAWNYVELAQGSRYNFTPEFFVFHMYSHMAYHFLSGGCGIRSLLDIWVVEQKMNTNYTVAEKLLKKAGIYTFASQMSKIANECFTLNERDEFSDLVLKYIFSGGVYGNKQNHIAVKKSKKTSSIGYVLGRIFMPYKAMAMKYPVLRKCPILLPIFWVVRCFSVIFKGKSKEIKSELLTVNKVSDDKITEISEICAKLKI